MTDSPPYAGLYINLDRSIDRRQAMEDQLRRFNLADRYARFAAVDARDSAASGGVQPGEAACFRSHHQALMKARNSGLAVHILEDDVLLSQYLDEAARTIVASNLFDRFDIVFTDTFVHTDVMQLGFYKQAFDHALAGGRNEMKFTVIDLAQRHLASMASYFVAAKSVDKVLGIFREELERGPRVPVDFCVRQAAQESRLRVGCWFPFVTSMMLEYITASTISGRANQHNNPSVMLPALLRYSFFIDHDLETYAKRYLDGMIGDASGRTVDPHRDFLMALMEFIVSGRYRTF